MRNLGILALCALVGGCASVARGTTENISIASTPSGAEAVISGLDVPTTCLTPCAVVVKRNADISVAFQKEGFEPQVVQLTKEIQGDHLDDKRMTFNHALKSRRVGISEEILTGIYDIEHGLRARIERLGETDWGRRLDDAMAAVASDLKNELQSFPEDTHHVLASRSLHRHHPATRLLASLVQKGRDLVGLAHNAAG